MKRFLLYTLLIFPIVGNAQNVEFGFGSSYDFGIDFPNIGKYFTKNEYISTMSLDAFIGIPVGERIMLRPSFIYSIPLNSLYLVNTEGDEVPLGYNLTVPYLDANDGWVPTLYSDDYTYYEAEGQIWQRSYGSYVMYVLTEGVEIGAGLFLRDKIIEATTYTAYDEYSWYASTDTTFDHYYHVQTWINPQGTTERIHHKTLSFPLTLNFKYEGNGVYNGFSFSWWVPGDNYFTFRYTFALTFGD